MIDFWEILGRAVTDDGFRNKMYDAFAKTEPKPNPNERNKYACMFANVDYDSARELVVAKMGPVSLMGLGEWLVVSALHPKSRALLNNTAGIVQQILHGYNSTSPVFYQTLGASIVDSGFRDKFNAESESDYGFVLSSADRAALTPVVSDGAFGLECDKFHELAWDEACKDMVIQSQGEPYAHALEVAFEP
jgi:hypothetical protein